MDALKIIMGCVPTLLVALDELDLQIGRRQLELANLAHDISLPAPISNRGSIECISSRHGEEPITSPAEASSPILSKQSPRPGNPDHAVMSTKQKQQDAQLPWNPAP